MAKQKNIPNELLDYEKNILELEKKYTMLLAEYLESPFFLSELKKIFIELNQSTEHVSAIYDGANIINTPAERLVSYCMYHEFFKRKAKGIEEFKKVDCYSYPICGDLAILLYEVVLNIEVKTVSKNKNVVDIDSLPFRPNQTSFTNMSPYTHIDESTGYSPMFKIQGHIPKYHRDKPILTFVIEIIYDYDNTNPRHPFKCLEGEFHGCTALNLFCVPNGELGRLFEDNIFQGIKTYKYYDETKARSDYYDMIKLDTSQFPDLGSCVRDVDAVYQYLYSNVDKINENWKRANNNDYVAMIDTERIGTELHEQQGTLWTLTTKKNKNTGIYEPFLRAIKSPDSCRIDWKENLVDRYDSMGNSWKGVRHITV